MSATSATAHAHVEPAGHHELGFIRTYMFSTDHKMIARQFLFLGLSMMIIGGLLALVVRWELAWPETPVPGLGMILTETGGILEPSQYNMAFTMHATIMIFFVIMPILAGAFGNFCIPLMIGARDMAFPFLNMLSFWVRSEEHTSELQSQSNIVCRLLLEKKNESTGNFQGAIDWVVEVIQESSCNAPGKMKQQDATDILNDFGYPLISTDPPYYDNIGYADLSDFFYVWLRRSLNNIYPGLFSTMLVPKSQELIATPFRFNGNRGRAQEFFEAGLGKAFERMRSIQNPEYPLTIYYAFKQSEAEVDEGEETNTLFALASTG